MSAAATTALRDQLERAGLQVERLGRVVELELHVRGERRDGADELVVDRAVVGGGET